MIGLNTLIPLEIELGTLSTLIAGLYVVYSAINPVAVPESLYIEIAEKLEPYLYDWDYDKITFEDWIKYNLLIIPKAMCTEEDIEHYKKNTVYFERDNGNAVLVVTFEV